MKATSYVFAGLQKPLTVFGLPVWLHVTLGCSAVLVMVLCVVTGFMALSLPAAVVVFAVGWYKLFQRVRADHHFGNIIVVVPGFWLRKGRLAKGHALLLAGIPAASGKSGRTHIRLPLSAQPQDAG